MRDPKVSFDGDRYYFASPSANLDMAFLRVNAEVRNDLMNQPDTDGHTPYRLRLKSIDLFAETNVDNKPVYRFTFKVIYPFYEE